MSSDIRRFIRKCDGYLRNMTWRSKKRRFLVKSLRIADRIWQKLSMDFVVDLSRSVGYTNLIIVIDKLGKGVMLEAFPDIVVEIITKWFVSTYYRQHEFPRAIVSD